MKRTKSFAVLTGTLLLITAFLSGCHGRPDGSPEERIDKGFEFFADKLDFTDEQEKKLDKVKEEIKTELAKYKGTHEKHREAAIALVEKDSITKDDVMNLIEEQRKVRDQLEPFFAEKIAEIHAIMTPDQRKEVVEKMKEGQKKGRRRGPGFF